MSLPAARDPAAPAAGSPSSPIETFLARNEARIEEHLATHRIPPEDTAELLNQALVMLVYRWDEIADPDAWLAATLRSHCQRYWRRRGRGTTLSSTDGDLL